MPGATLTSTYLLAQGSTEADEHGYPDSPAH